ncbi:hypothetical protein N7462_009938 [Penicillium macrosclerotiorum]|uniref:uncharacterized protein n=1 Tax=Penicillium macrosclerotiorum TaxID=303699 RepID=UPI00254947F0|nr:uncharacterized protein N7462_009938 [Penicillium macrosclerotiorum]KAJ5668868.1 hypothetical protein N7462_009938 [Penicillium macrosclerotiorum]
MDPHTATLLARADSSGRPAFYKAVGISLAVASGVFIGISFVIKKVGLLKANIKYNEEAGEGYGYLKNAWWWLGMTLMIIGEICNFVAYCFVDAILVTPLGALSVVITTILSAIFLKERLSFVGKVGCFSCILGSVIIAMNAPDQSSVDDIQEMQKYVLSPGFLVYGGIILIGAAFTAIWVGPRYGKKSMFPYISICSSVGGLSVVATQGLGSAIIAQIDGEEQFKHWFLYVLFVFVVCTLLTEIIFLNKALNLFNAALVTPTYYVLFTSATIITSAILFRGFKATGVQIATVIMGFLQICSGVVLLQLSKSAKDVPDAAVFKGDLDQLREVATQEGPEYEPKADSIRGAASIIRRISTVRRTQEADEARRFVQEKQEDYLKPPSENEIIEWDGIRRRRTVIGAGPTMSRPHTPRSPSIKQNLPPLGMSRFPDHVDAEEHRPSTKQSGHSFLSDFRSRTSSMLHPGQWLHLNDQDEKQPLSAKSAPPNMTETGNGEPVDTEYHGAGHAGVEASLRPTGRERSDTPRSISWADKKEEPDTQTLDPPMQTARRQFSFNGMFNRNKSDSNPSSPQRPVNSPRGILRHTRSGTEEERLGLVRGDTRAAHPEEESLGEKLDRWSSAESDAGEVHPLQPARPHHDSVSSMSTAAFPPYEDQHAFFTGQSSNVSNPYYLPPTRQVPASYERGDAEHESWQMGSRSRTRTNSSSHGRAPPPAHSSFSTHRHPNPLPPLPDETTMADDPTGVRSVSSGSSDMGVTSIPSSVEAHDDDNVQPTYLSRSQSGWRRHMSEVGSDDGETYQQRRSARGGGTGGTGAFL